MLERIAAAVEQNTAAQLMLLDELTSEPEPAGEGEDPGMYLDGTPKH